MVKIEFIVIRLFEPGKSLRQNLTVTLRNQMVKIEIFLEKVNSWPHDHSKVAEPWWKNLMVKSSHKWLKLKLQYHGLMTIPSASHRLRNGMTQIIVVQYCRGISVDTS